MKQLCSYAVLSVNGGDRVSYTYDEIDDQSGDVISSNNKGSFFVVDKTLKKNVDAIRTFIQENKLEG